MNSGLDYRRLTFLEAAFDTSPKEPSGIVKFEVFMKAVRKLKTGISDKLLHELLEVLKDENNCVPYNFIMKLLQSAKFARIVTTSYNRDA